MKAIDVGMNIFIVESPAKAKTIRGYLGNDYRVVATCGHVRDLPADRIGIALENDTFEADYTVTKRDVVRRIQAEVDKAQCVWLATDGDREGEGIAAHLLACLRVPPGVPVRRAVFHEITHRALQSAVANPRDLCAPMVDAQNTRRLLDRMIGYQVSPLLWEALGHKDLSAGRVQSAALHLLLEHQRSIDHFVPTWQSSATALFLGPEGLSFRANYQLQPSSELNETWMHSLGHLTWKILEVGHKEDVRHPPPPFTTSTLQQEASRRLRLTTKQVMRAAQALYEAGHITYMRTDSTSLSASAQQAILQRIETKFGDVYKHPRQYRSRDPNAQEAHEAIRPTYADVETVAGMTNAERALYQLILQRTLASQMAPAREAVYEIQVSDDPGKVHAFVARARKTLFDGFRRLWAEDIESTVDIPSVERYERWVSTLLEGTVVEWKQAEVAREQTLPPRHLTEATFVRALEEAGIGRPSTYEPTLATLDARGYMERQTTYSQDARTITLQLSSGMKAVDQSEETKARKENYILRPTSRGAAVGSYLQQWMLDLVSPETTRRMEEGLDEVAAGTRPWKELLRDYQKGIRLGIANAKTACGDLSLREAASRYRKEAVGSSRGQLPLVLGEPPHQAGWTVKVFPQGKFGPFVMLCPPQKSRSKPVFVGLPKPLEPGEVTLDQALQLLASRAPKPQAKPGGSAR